MGVFVIKADGGLQAAGLWSEGAGNAFANAEIPEK